MNKAWLDHLENAVPNSGQGNRISAYTISLEGWRRGLDLSFFNVYNDNGERRLRYKLTGYGRTHEFQLSMGDKVTQEAFDICKNKEVTKQYLMKGQVPVPMGKVFNEHSNVQEMVDYAKSIEFPVVVKPTDSNAGKGVFANIDDEQELMQIINHVREALGFSKIMIEKFVSGNECRVYVIEDRVIAAMNRIPANVEGDGLSTIKELINKKNQARKLNPHLSKRLINIDAEINQNLENSGYNINDILEKGKVLFLREKSNLSTGGDAVNITDTLHPNVAKIAINAGKSIPGLVHYGVDIIVNEDGDDGVVLEVNTRPGLGGHLFPGQGKAIDVPKEIIDYYFPETKGVEINNFYYDFDSVIEALTKRTSNEINIIANPKGEKYGMKYTLESSLLRDSLNKAIVPMVRNYNLHGFIDYTNKQNIKLVVSSNEKDNVNLFSEFLYSMENIIVINEMQWDAPVKIGFEIIDELTYKTKTQLKNYMNKGKKLDKVNKENNKLKKQLKIIERRLLKVEEELKDSKLKYEEIEEMYHSVINSKSWKYTSFFRKISSNLKKS